MSRGIATLVSVDDSRGSKVEPIRGAPNAGTMVLPGDPDARIAPDEIARAWSSLVPALSRISSREPGAGGYRLFWTGCGETGFRDFSCDPEAHLIVGRHARADVVLGADAELSLRHLLIVPERAAGGAALRLIDLRASTPMFLDDDAPHRSLRVEGPFAVRLGRYVLGGFPIGAAHVHPPAELPRAERVDASVADRAPAAPACGPYRDQAWRSKSVITLLPRPITMIDSVGSEHGDAIGLLGAAREGERVRIGVRADDLRAGVLLGRADKCTDPLRPLLTIRVSRVHAVLIERGGRTMIYDCASTNGTQLAGRQVRSVIVGRDGPVVQLAGRDGIEIRWTPFTGEP